MRAETVSPRLDAALLEPVFRRLEERVRAGEIGAAALAVGDAEGPLRSATFAHDPRRSISPASYFFLASLSKPIFATAVMQLVEDGRLELHAPVARYVSDFVGQHKERVTAWHLLTHTSGVADIPTEVIRRQRPSGARMTELALGSPLNFEPGSRWEYCTATYYILGELVRRITGVGYPEYLRDNLIAPLGMETTFDPRRTGRPIVHIEGVGADNPLKRFLLLRYVASIAAPGGGLFGTLHDVLTFGAAILRPRAGARRALPLETATIELMARDHTRGLPGLFGGELRAVHFGLGWNKPTLMGAPFGSSAVVSHGGATGTLLWIDPAANVTFAFFTNRWEPDRALEQEALRGVYEALAGR